MTTLCLIRHGETDYNLQSRIQGSVDIPLNEQGRQQARTAAAYVARGSWDVFYSSPLSRARETAEIIAEAAGITNIHTEPRLVERGFGEAEGMKLHELRASFRRGAIPGAESWDEVRNRALEAALEIVKSNPGQRVLAVAHGGLIGGLLAGISGGELGPGRPPLDNCSMTMLEFDGHWRICWYNRVASDLDLEPAPASC
jgi:broad specificity phosphatase PhoE